jgi:hypothetical protein
MVLAILSIILFSIIRLVTIIGTWFWRIGISIYNGFYSVGQTAIKYRTELVIAVVIFGGGIAAIQFQEETMTGLDIFYQCGLEKSFEIVESIYFYLVRVPYDFMAQRIDDVLLYFKGCLTQFISDVKMITNIVSVGGFVDLFHDIYVWIKCMFLAVGSVPSIQVPYLSDIITKIENLIFCITDTIETIFRATLTLTIINQDCTFCQLDPGAICVLRHQVINFPLPGSIFPAPDCTQCYDFVAEAFGCLAIISDYITLGRYTIQIEHIFNALACFVNAWFKPPFWLIQGLIDGCISSGSIPAYLNIWFTDIINCANDLICALTAPPPMPCTYQFFDLIFSYLFSFASIVVNGIEAIIACDSDPTFVSCLQNWPNGAGPNGQCQVDGSGNPINGLHVCFQINNICLSPIPLLQPLVSSGLLNILPSLALALDYVVCPFNALAICFSSAYISANCPPGGIGGFVNQGLCVAHCVQNNVPIFSAIAQVVIDFLTFLATIVNGINSAINNLLNAILAIQSAFACFNGACIVQGINDPLGLMGGCNIGTAVGCLVQCFTDPHACGAKKRNSEFGSKRDGSLDIPENVTNSQDAVQWAREIWQSQLQSYGVLDNTTCGKVIYATLPNEIPLYSFADYSNYWTCLGMYIYSYNRQQQSGNSYDINSVMDYTTFFSTITQEFQSQGNVTIVKRNYNELNNEFGIGIPSNTTKVYNYSDEGIISSFIFRVSKRITDYYEGVQNGTNSPPAIFFFNSVFESFKNTTYYDISVSFYNEYKEKQKEQRSNVLRSDRVIDPYLDLQMEEKHKGELEEIYLRHVNAWRYYFSKSTKKSSPRRIVLIQKPIANQISLKEEGETFRMFTVDDMKRGQESVKMIGEYAHSVNSSFEKLRENSEVLNRIYMYLNERYDIEFWPSFQKFHMALHTISNGDLLNFFQWVNGTKGYLASEGFVDISEYREKMDSKDLKKRGSLMDVVFGEYKSMENATYGPFLFSYNESHSSLPSTREISDYIRELHEKKQIERAEVKKKKEFESMAYVQSLNDGDFDANQIIYNIVDWFIGLFGPKQPITNAVDNVVNFFTGSDIPNFFNVDVKNWFINYFGCAIPENIDGSQPYSPWCFPLFPIGIFNFITLQPDGGLPLQIPWPNELIVQNCTKIFNGNSYLFAFEFSDNCKLMDSITRPFCPSCDYCPATFSSCSANRFGDVLDTILYILAIFPRVLDTFFTGGLPLSIVDNYATFITGSSAILAIFILPILLWIKYLLLWTVFKIFGSNIPWGMLLIVATIIVLTIFAQLSFAFVLFFTITGVLSALWIVSLFVAFPTFANSFNLISALITATNWFGSWTSSFFSVQPLIGRLQRFDFSANEPIPAIDTFCFFWTFSNIGLLFIIILLTPTFFLFALDILYVTFLLIFDLVILIFEITRLVKIERIRRSAEDLQNWRGSLPNTYSGYRRGYTPPNISTVHPNIIQDTNLVREIDEIEMLELRTNNQIGTPIDRRTNSEAQEKRKTMKNFVGDLFGSAVTWGREHTKKKE